MVLNCIVVDDDELARTLVAEYVEKTPFLKLKATCSSAKEAMRVLKEERVDLIFLDVEMPEMSGIDFIREFKEKPQIILISAKKEYAAEAFDYNVTDFIVKPAAYARFLKAAEKAMEIEESIKVSDENKKELYIKKDSRLVKIDCKEILYVEALSDYVNIYTTTARFTVLSTMKGLEAKLPAKEFSRIHRSFIVRLDKIKAIEDGTVVVNEHSLPISNSYKKEFFNVLNIL
jgi:DNA-binding LytR/AlgR family response regulator